MTVTKESETKEGFCQCGQPLHYSVQSIKNMVDQLAQRARDPFITINGYRVQRHFLALHGFSVRIAEEYGFEKVGEHVGG